MAMLEGLNDLSLERLNQVTQVWAGKDYNERRHAELGMTPFAPLPRYC
jgi:hypothetical protein